MYPDCMPCSGAKAREGHLLVKNASKCRQLLRMTEELPPHTLRQTREHPAEFGNGLMDNRADDVVVNDIGVHVGSLNQDFFYIIR